LIECAFARSAQAPINWLLLAMITFPLIGMIERRPLLTTVTARNGRSAADLPGRARDAA
jgi:hypothetical protein